MASSAPIPNTSPNPNPTMPSTQPIYTHQRPLGSILNALQAFCLPNLRSDRPRNVPQIKYLTTAEDVNAVIPSIQSNCHTFAQTIGFDLEWDVVPKHGKAAVMQLCTADTIYVVQLSAMSPIPTSLVEIMADASLLKIGVAVRNDAHKLRRDFGINSEGLVELSAMAKLLDQDLWKHRRLLVSLSDLCEYYLQHTLRKDAIRVSRWSRQPLSEAQLMYAASDVYVSLELFHQLAYHAFERHRLQSLPSSSPWTPDAGLEHVMDLVRQATGRVDQAPAKNILPKKPANMPVRKGSRDKLLAHHRALSAWRNSQLDLASVAANAGIQRTTSAGYVIRALQEELSATKNPRNASTAWSMHERSRLRQELTTQAMRKTVQYHSVFLRSYGVFSDAELKAMR
ncbi:hypothetical protein MYAM1_002622 [Malassezia yamatoensis]|uniref:3'-5' exonuclease n=1 Tax=Malassezia yamatoensis TaxID=253288 RepID=A0AAJ5YW89_9BASI|nr:hypothetical protein MYAM1_002622 [Malassezia yamatoensis]